MQWLIHGIELTGQEGEDQVGQAGATVAVE